MKNIEKKVFLTILFLLVLILIPIFLTSLNTQEIEEDDIMMERKAYTNLGIVSAKKPVNSHLWLEVNSAGSHYTVATGDLTHLWYSADKMDTEAKIDIDPGNAHGGDNDHRPANIVSAFHDRANKIIYFVDHSGGTTIYSWKLDYSASESAPTITERGTIAGLTTVGDADIFLIGSDVFIWYVDTLELTVVKWVDPNWINQDTAGSTSHPLSRVAVVGTIVYILLDAAPVILFSYTNGTTTMASIETFIGLSLPSSSNLLGIAYDGSNILKFILNLDADGKNYLFSYNISGDSQTQSGEFNVSLMLNRNTAAGILEKAFHITANGIYQLHSELPYQLHLIAKPITDDIWIAITDNFLMNDGGDMYEFEDITAYVTELAITMKKMGHWTATMSQINTYLIEEGMFVVITDRFTTAANSPFLYRGTYNFKDEVDGTSGTSIGFVDMEAGDDSTFSATIVASEDGHKKVIKFLAAGDNTKFAQWRHTESETAQTIEFWWKYIDNGVGIFRFTGIRTSGSATIINFYFDSATNLLTYQYGDGVGGTTTDTVAAPADTWHHIRLTYSAATDTQSLWFNGVLIIDDEPFMLDRTISSVLNWRFQLDDGAGANALQGFLDAYGEAEDPNYTVGDNNYVAEGEDQTIFEGYVGPFTKRFIQDVQLVSPAKRDLDEEFPDGDYSGRTDQIIVLLLADHGDYITAGTMSAGMAMGTITFSGDKSLREIFDEFALQDNFIWSLNPVGVMTYNNGTTDSLILLTASSPISNVDKTFGERALNYVNIKGGFVDGAQVVGTPAQNIPGQQTNGRLPFEQTFSHLDLAAQCTTTNTNVLARLGTQPLIVPFTHKDSLIGVIQPGELVTFEYDLTDPNISRFQGLILDCIYDAKQGKANYRISDIVI